MSRVECNRAAEVVEALTCRAGPLTLTPEQRGMLVGGVATITLQTQELMLSGLLPAPAAALVFHKCSGLLGLLGLTHDEMRAVFQAAADDISEAAR